MRPPPFFTTLLRHRSSAAATCPFAGGGTAAPAARPTAEAAAAALPFEAVPTPRGLPLVGTLWDLVRSGGSAKIHEYCDRRHRELGPIYREKMGAMDVVVISDVDYFRKVYLFEGKWPVHLVPEPWVIYNKTRGITRGLFFMDGEQWRNTRMPLNHILSSKLGEKHTDTFNDVVGDVIDRLGVLSCRSPDGAVPCLETELYNWSIETLGTMVFGRRLGCVVPGDGPESPMHEFVKHVRQIFTESATMSVVPPTLAYRFNLPVWRRFEKAADNALEMSRGYVMERLGEIEKLKKENKPVDGMLVEIMEKIDNEKDVVNIVADLILAAADTTSHATQWALYLLSKHPEVQDRIVREVNAVVPKGDVINDRHLPSLPILMNIIKETLRLYPIASFLTRYLVNDIVLGKYLIPKGKLIFMSQYTIGRDPKPFPDPESFMPDRWIQRPDDSQPSVKNASMPFGYGPRSCVGRKVAELKMQLLIARTLLKYRLEYAGEEDVGIALRMITTPDRPIKIRFTERNT